MDPQTSRFEKLSAQDYALLRANQLCAKPKHDNALKAWPEQKNNPTPEL